MGRAHRTAYAVPPKSWLALILLDGEHLAVYDLRAGTGAAGRARTTLRIVAALRAIAARLVATTWLVAVLVATTTLVAAAWLIAVLVATTALVAAAWLVAVLVTTTALVAAAWLLVAVLITATTLVAAWLLVAVLVTAWRAWVGVARATLLVAILIAT